MKRVMIALAFWLALPSLALADERSQANENPERAREHKRFARAGFVPIAEVTAQGRSVRRLLLSDPYMGLAIPAMELEKRADGQIVVKIQHRGWSSEARSVDVQAWTDLEALEAEVFVDRSKAPQARATAAPASAPPPICHGWRATIEADADRLGSWIECSDAANPARQYALIMIKAALSTQPGCVFDPDSPFWSYQNCFGFKPQLDDPDLSREYVALLKANENLKGSDILAEARLALQVPGISLGNDKWIAARSAVLKMREYDKTRRELLQRMAVLEEKARNASDADRSRIRDTIVNWSTFIQGTEPNTFQLYDKLVGFKK